MDNLSSNENKRHGSIIKGLVFFLFFTFFSLFILSFYTGQDNRSLLGSGTTVIRNNNLSPDLKNGDLAIIVSTPINDLSNGDVIVFKRTDELKKMRVDHVKDDNIILSDGNKLVNEEYRGRISNKVPLIGYLYVLIEQPISFFLIILIFSIAILMNLRKNLVRDRERKLESIKLSRKS